MIDRNLHGLTSPMFVPRRNALLKLFWRIHRWTYRASSGRVGGRLLGRPVLLMTTIGHKSGLPREVTLYYFEHEGQLVVVASNAGHAAHPAWYRNLQASPEAQVLAGRRQLRVTARIAQGEERKQLWPLALELDPNYQVYEARTNREIPVVVLEPVEALRSSP